MDIFKNILIPIDLQAKAHIAIDKALELCEATGSTTIHLVSVLPVQSVWQKFFLSKNMATTGEEVSSNKLTLQNKLAILGKKIISQHPGCEVCTTVITGAIPSKILTDYANEHAIDLVIITKKKETTGIFQRDASVQLVKKLNIPVLSITAGCLNHPIKSILLPVNAFVPERRIEVALAFARKYHAHIHLVTLLDNNELSSKTRVDAFYKTYKILTEYGHAPNYKILKGMDDPDILLRYADQIKADMILVNPEKKFSLMGLMRRNMQDPFSALHVLTCQSYIKHTA